MTVNNDAYPLQTAPDTDWINAPDSYGINEDEQEHVTGVSSGMSLAALTDIPTPYGIDVAKADDTGPQTADMDDQSIVVGFEPIVAAMARLMSMNDGAVKTREIAPTRFSTQRYVITPGQSPILALGDDPYRRRLSIGYIGAVGDQPTISNEASGGEGFPIPLATTYLLDITSCDEVWVQPASGATGNATVVLLFERDSD